MVKTIASVGLPIDETLRIKKNRLMPEGATDGGKRISIVTGIHGDELEGQYVCFELQHRIEAEKEKLTGIVDIYPAMNPLGIDSVTRGIPAFDLDMNRLFPGNIAGSRNHRGCCRFRLCDRHSCKQYLSDGDSPDQDQ